MTRLGFFAGAIVALGTAAVASQPSCDERDARNLAPLVQGAVPARPEAVKRWRDLRFGMFIHWGPVSLTGKEIGWSRGRETPVEEYDNLYKRFNPVKFNADEWVSVAKSAGMKYIVLTTKHHDGFCLWDTKETDYNIMNTPFGRDVTKELSDACRRAGLAFGAYYSTCDWHHPDFPLTSPGGKTPRATHDLDRYTDYMKAQSRELLVNYGPLLCLWHDVPQQFDVRRGAGVINMERAIQPDILVNNRTRHPGDFDTPEQRVGKFQLDRPWETCMTICRQWAWKPNDTMKPLDTCVHALLRTIGGDGNFLFNVGPQPDGLIEPRQVARLKEMGDWVGRHAAAIYGTRGGPWKPSPLMVSTRRGDKVYLHFRHVRPHARRQGRADVRREGDADGPRAGLRVGRHRHGRGADGRGRRDVRPAAPGTRQAVDSRRDGHGVGGVRRQAGVRARDGARRRQVDAVGHAGRHAPGVAAHRPCGGDDVLRHPRRGGMLQAFQPREQVGTAKARRRNMDDRVRG